MPGGNLQIGQHLTNRGRPRFKVAESPSRQFHPAGRPGLPEIPPDPFEPVLINNRRGSSFQFIEFVQQTGLGQQTGSFEAFGKIFTHQPGPIG